MGCWLKSHGKDFGIMTDHTNDTSKGWKQTTNTGENFLVVQPLKLRMGENATHVNT